MVNFMPNHLLIQVGGGMITFHFITPYCVSKQITYMQKMLFKYHSNCHENQIFYSLWSW